MKKRTRKQRCRRKRLDRAIAALGASLARPKPRSCNRKNWWREFQRLAIAVWLDELAPRG